MDESGEIKSRVKVKTERRKGYEAVRDRILDVIRESAAAGGVSLKEINLIGVACAGQIDKKSGSIIFSPNLGWHDAPLGEDIEDRLHIPTCVENDANAAAYGEWRFGLETPARDMVGIFIGTGIGGGLIFDGKLYRGSHDVGGELGHITLNPYGYRCNCGNVGCFEAFCGGLYVTSRVRKSLAEGYRGALWDVIEGKVGHLHTGHIEEAFLRNDSLCLKVWGEVIEYLGVALQSVANLLNPEVIVLGGGVINGTRYLVEHARVEMEKRTMPASLKGLSLERARLGEDAMILGAAFME